VGVRDSLGPRGGKGNKKHKKKRRATASDILQKKKKKSQREGPITYVEVLTKNRKDGKCSSQFLSKDSVANVRYFGKEKRIVRT